MAPVRRRRASRLLFVAAAGIALAAAAIRSVLRRRRASTQAAAPQARRPLTCGCGQEYVVAGSDRHRVFWRAGAPEGEPVLGDSCPVCQASLPAEPAATPA